MDENGTQRRGQRKLAGVPRAVAMVSLVMFLYGELAERVYPFVLLPHLGVTLRVVLLTLFAVVHATLQFGLRTGILMFFATAFVTWLFEQVGVVTGTVYGAYHYSGMLGPKVGEVPLLIPLAWFMMIYPSYVVTSLIIDGRPLPDKTNLAQLGTRALVAAFVMTAWDAVIDPGMARSGFWVWEHGGSYFGVPRQNFAGWLLTTFIVYIVFGLMQRWLKPNLPRTRDWFALLPAIAYASVTLTQVADYKAGPSSVVALFAMGLPALLAFIRWSQRAV
jgi:uncharacterized membrane protein